MRLAATIRYVTRFGPGSFEEHCHIKEVFETTTIAELIEWQRNMLRNDREIQLGLRIKDMRIGPME